VAANIGKSDYILVNIERYTIRQQFSQLCSCWW